MSLRETSEPQDSAEKQDRLVNEIRRIAAILGVDRLTQREFDRYHSFGCLSTVGYQFGSWNRAVVAAGLKPNQSGGADREPVLDATELLEEILRLSDELKKLPSERELSRFGKFSLKPYRDRWGTFNRAKEAAEAYEKERRQS
jgi:hypothetical protein